MKTIRIEWTAPLAAMVLLLGTSWSLAVAAEPSTITAVTVPLPEERSHRLCARHGNSPQCVSTGKIKAAQLAVEVNYTGGAPVVAVTDCGAPAAVGVEVRTLSDGASLSAKIIAPGTLSGAEEARLDIPIVDDRGVCFLVTGE